MTRETLNPAALYDSKPYGFSHAAVGTGHRLVHCAGQVAWDHERRLIGEGAHAAQIEQCLANLREILAAAGGGPSDVVRLRTFMVDHDAAALKALGAALARFYGAAPPAPNTVVGVVRLAMPGFLVEIEADASID